MASRRTQRVQREMLKVLSGVLLREMSDERLGKSMVTFTATKASADFSYLDVWVSVQGEERHQRAMLTVIERARPFLRKRLGEETSLRIVPELRFHLDQTLEHAARIDDLLGQVEEERQQRARALGTDSQPEDGLGDAPAGAPDQPEPGSAESDEDATAT